MANCIKKSAPSILDSVLQKYSTSFFQYETARILSLDPAMKNMGVASFIVDMDKLEDILDDFKGEDGNILDVLIEKSLTPEYISRVDLGVELTESYLDVINVIASTNRFLETLVEEVLTNPVGTTLILVEKQPESNTATNKIFETILSFFCQTKYRNLFVNKSKVLEHILIENSGECPEIPTQNVTPLGYTAIIPLEGYSKNSISLYSGSVERIVKHSSKYLQNKADTSSLFRKYCLNTGVRLGQKEKIDDMSDAFCMTVFAIGKLVSYRE